MTLTLQNIKKKKRKKKKKIKEKILKIKKKKKKKKNTTEGETSIDEIQEELKDYEITESNIDNKNYYKKIKNKFYKNEDIKNLMIYASRGLERLQKFYEKQYDDGMFMIGIKLIVNTLREGINGKLDTEKL